MRLFGKRLVQKLLVESLYCGVIVRATDFACRIVVVYAFCAKLTDSVVSAVRLPPSADTSAPTRHNLYKIIRRFFTPCRSFFYLIENILDIGKPVRNGNSNVDAFNINNGFFNAFKPACSLKFDLAEIFTRYAVLSAASITPPVAPNNVPAPAYSPRIESACSSGRLGKSIPACFIILASSRVVSETSIS